MRSFRLETGQEPFLGNCRLVILGEAAARQQTGEIMDTLLSDHELRPGTPLCLTAGQAAGLLTRSAEELGELLQAAARAGRCPDSTLLTVVRSLESMGNTAAAARLEAAGPGAGAGIRSHVAAQRTGVRTDSGAVEGHQLPAGKRGPFGIHTPL